MCNFILSGFAHTCHWSLSYGTKLLCLRHARHHSKLNWLCVWCVSWPEKRGPTSILLFLSAKPGSVASPQLSGALSGFTCTVLLILRNKHYVTCHVMCVYIIVNVCDIFFRFLPVPSVNNLRLSKKY